MKALLLCQNLKVGGAEELILGMSTALPSVGVDTGVVALTQRGPIGDEIAAAGVPVHLVAGQPGPRDPAAFLRLVRLLRREQPDVVHTFLITAGIYGRLAAFAAGVPVVIAAEQNVYQRKPRHHALMERALAARTHRIVACCEAVGSFYRRQVGLPASKVSVVDNAVRFDAPIADAERAPARAALGLPEDAVVLGTLGRLTEQKGQHLLLDALPAVLARVPNVQVFLAGDGPLRPSLAAQAARLGIGDRVRFLGIRRDRRTLFAAMDVFVLPSSWEGLSLALVEAVGNGRAVVASAVGGNPEVVTDGQTGLLVPSGDTAALTDALVRLASDPAERLRLGTVAAADARTRFSIERHVSEIAAIYRQGLAQRGRLPARVGAV